MTEMPEYFVSLADQNFNTHKLWKQKDEDNYLFEVREDIEAYIAVLGILSGPAYMAISRFFDRWNAEEEEYIESIRRLHKTENDIRRAQGKLQEDEDPIIIVAADGE